MAIRNDYEVSSEGAVRHWEVSKARLENNAPTATQPCAVLAVAANINQLAGTILVTDEALHGAGGKVVADFTASMVYKHFVRNVRTYAGAAESTFGAIDQGHLIYYDRSSTMPADVFLSTSPLDKDGAANPLFGRAVLMNEDDTLPKGAGTASTQEVGVMQRGAGG